MIGLALQASKPHCRQKLPRVALFDWKALAAEIEAYRAGNAIYTDHIFAAANFHLWYKQTA